uniref:Uncharacterized protein n=1 Tax=Panagrolaimus sp. PS1159 TaxID=55785 RepID=A0AC35GWE1_9BILA
MQIFSETCHETVIDAKRSCFDASAIGPGDGDLLFRIENIQYQSCGLEGSFSVEYSRINEMNLKCSADSGSEMQNCDSKEELHFRFRNCSFPEFDQKLTCLGSWASIRNENFVALFDQDTRQYRCGKLTSGKNESQLIVATDATCSKLESNIAFEKYRLITKNKKQIIAACEFPEWLQGEYDGISIKAEEIRHRLPNSPPLTSTCVEVDNERILVHTETSCGESLGYHCLWFKSRSNSIIEFKTTIIATEGNTVCRKEEEFSKAVWTTLISKTPKKSACAFFGSYSTPKEMQINDCYNLTVNCKKRNKFKIVAYHCQSGIAYDVKTYDCYGTWKENDNLFVYTKTQDSQNENVCMISRQQGDYLYLAILGNHCNRNFNFSENPDSVLVLKRTEDCSNPTMSSLGKPLKPILMISSTPSTRRLSPPRRQESTNPNTGEQFAIQNRNYTISGSQKTTFSSIFNSCSFAILILLLI